MVTVPEKNDLCIFFRIKPNKKREVEKLHNHVALCKKETYEFVFNCL